jgi:putative spermidine/putrescine transport system permease protein
LVTLPLAAALIHSLLYSFGLTGMFSNGFTLSNWQNLFAENSLISNMLYSLTIATLSIVISVLTALYLSYSLAFKRPSRSLLSILFIPLLFSPLIAAFVSTYLLGNSGVISRMLFHASLINDLGKFPDIVNDNLSIGIIVTLSILLFALFSIVFYNSIKKEKLIDLKQAAQNLGATNKDFITKIFVPVVISRNKLIILLYFLFSIAAYEIPLLLGQESPRMVSVYITDSFSKFDLRNIATSHALCVLYILLTLVILYLFFKISKRTA